MHIKRIGVHVIAGLLLLMLILPQVALADPAASISLFPSYGRCGDEIEVTATVEAAGTYRICWDSMAPDNVKETFTASAAGNYTIELTVPQATKGTYTVYLTAEDYSELANAEFVVSPSVQIDTEEGPVGTPVTLNGYGFAASQEIQVKFKGTVIETTTANTAGTWDISLTVPATSAGDYTFVVEFKEDAVWYDLVGKYFKVTPEITAPSSGTVGHTIEVKGTGFASGEDDIKVTFDEVVVKENIPADGNGSWTTIILIPPLRRGSYTMDASGELTRARDVPDVSFTLSAGVLVEPTSAYVDDTITVAGGGFATGETGIRVTFEGTTVASGITADTDGCWDSSFVLPASSFGSHIVSASGDITKPAVTTTLNTKAKIEELSPVEGAPGDSATLTGSGFHGSQALTVTVAGIAVSGDMQTLANGNVVVNFRVPGGSPEGKQTLVVTDEGGATDSADFTVKGKVLTTPQTISPGNNTKFRSGDITFRWGGVTGGSDVTYILQISNSPDLSTYVWSRSDIETSSYILPEEEALPKGTYYWWVKAVDNYGNESPWSDSGSFRVSPIPIWVWVIVGVVVLVGLMVVAYRETKFKVTE